MIVPLADFQIDLGTLVQRKGPFDPRVATQTCIAVIDAVDKPVSTSVVRTAAQPTERLRPEHVTLRQDGATVSVLVDMPAERGSSDGRLVRDVGSLLHLMLHGVIPWHADSFDATTSAAGLNANPADAVSLASTLPDALKRALDWSLAESSLEHTLREFRRRLSATELLQPGPLLLDLRSAAEDVDVRVRRVLAGRYQLLRVIGRGALGTVYEASVVATSAASPTAQQGTALTVGARVAVKVLEDTAGDTGDRRAHQDRRIARELRSFARIEHANVVAMLDVGFDENLAAHFLVMELLLGCDLATRLAKTGPLEPLEAIELFIQASRGLAAAHDAGLVHRDVKPANLFLHKPQGAAATIVKVCDFGLARAIQGSEETAATRSGVLLGSPAYMSPEQLRDPRKADERSDIWSLGVALYQLLSGELPWRASGPGPLLAAIAQRKIRRLTDVAPHVPPTLAAVVDRAMAGPRQERYRSMHEFGAALEQLRRTRTPRRRPMLWAIVAGLSLAIAWACSSWLVARNKSVSSAEGTASVMPVDAARAPSEDEADPSIGVASAILSKVAPRTGCSLGPQTLAFGVRGLTVKQLKARVEATGYRCVQANEGWPTAPDGGAELEFVDPNREDCELTVLLGHLQSVLEHADGKPAPIRAGDGLAFLLTAPDGCDLPPLSLLDDP